MLIVAAAAVTIGVFVISNEVTVSRVYSFYNLNDANNNYLTQNDKSFGSGWDFRLKKDFTKSGLEYGINYMTYSSTHDYGYGSYTDTQNKWSFYLDYVHDINLWNLLKGPVNESLKSKLLFYAGPSIRIMNKIGVGGLVGARYRLFDRVNADLRYEYTTQSNQLQAGIQILYQRPK